VGREADGQNGARSRWKWNIRPLAAAGRVDGIKPAVAAIPETKLPKETLKRALSIQQPLSELILLGEKTEEYRSRLTHVRGRVYLYAGKKVATVEDFPEEEAQALPRSAIVGSVEIVGCHWDKEADCFAWELAKPRRYREPLKAKGGTPQPGFWHPTF
jgi:hypothetical protein